MRLRDASLRGARPVYVTAYTFGKPVQPIVGEELSPPIKIDVSATFFSDSETNPKSTLSGQADRPISNTENQSLTTQLDVGFLGSLRPSRSTVPLFDFLERTSGPE
jgi:hypothetical protein